MPRRIHHPAQEIARIQIQNGGQFLGCLLDVLNSARLCHDSADSHVGREFGHMTVVDDTARGMNRAGDLLSLSRELNE